MSNANADPRERSAVSWWRSMNPTLAAARLTVVRHNGTVFSYMVLPKDPGAVGRRSTYDRIVSDEIEAIVEEYEEALECYERAKAGTS